MSLDNIWFTKNSLSELANEFHAFGGTHLFIDEVHRYPALHIVFTGSSILEIYKSNADLSRRAISYHLYGLSFREFLNFETQLNFPVFTLKDILTNHINIVPAITTEIKVLPMLKKHIEYGYYPFYKEEIKSYGIRLQNVVNTILNNDLPSVENVEYHTIIK